MNWHFDKYDLIYGTLTAGLFLWSFVRANGPVKIIGSVTFAGWIYFQLVRHTLSYTNEQWVLAAGDAAQAIAIMWLVARHGLGRLPMWGFAVAFLAMLMSHALLLGLIAPAGSDFISYYTRLNLAYIMQLLALGGMMAKHEYTHIASWYRRHFDSSRRHSGGVAR